MKRFALAFFLLAFVSAPAMANWNILFEPSGTAGVTYSCTAYYRFSSQAHPTLVVAGSSLTASGPLTSSGVWTSATCNFMGVFPGQNRVLYFNIPNTVVDPNLPNVEVIACVKTVASDGITISACKDASVLTPYDINDPIRGGSTQAAVAAASVQ